MGKLQLKKELMGMTPEQVVQVVLDAYSARKEIKQYFDFFLDPDVNKLREKAEKLIDKELSRTRRNYCIARITVIRRVIKDFAAYDPGDEYVRNLMLFALRRIILLEKYYYFKDAFEKGARRLVDDLVAFADKHMLVDTTMEALRSMARDSSLGTASFRNRLLMRFA